MRKYVTEGIGTFFLVLTIGLAVASGSPMAPLAIGSALMVMIFMGGHISGAHYNPAVSTAMLINGKLSMNEYIGYVVAQLAGALFAAVDIWWLTGSTLTVAPAADASFMQALGVEILYTFALVLVIFNVAVSRGTKGNSFYGLAIGFTITAAAFAGGPISGGAFNPAVGIGPILVDAVAGNAAGMANILLYLVGPLIGGALAAYVYRWQDSE